MARPAAIRTRTLLMATVGAAVATGACATASPTAADPARADASTLPAVVALRSDLPYVSGTIASRTTGAAGLVRIHVRAAAEGARVDAAVVTVHPDSVLVWRDGTPATPDALTVGRAVTVWVHGPELRSYPPQVTGSAVVVERR